jgi:hypothetical protein
MQGGEAMRKCAAATALVIALNITMLVLAISASLTPANASCTNTIIVARRAGTPRTAFPLNYGGCFPGLKSPAIIEGPHNATAVLRPDGIVVVYPKPGFTGQDPMKVRFSLPIGSTIGSSVPQFTTVTNTYVIWVY